MSQVVGEDHITGLGFIGLEPGRIYRMRRGPKVTTVTVRGNPAVLEHSVKGRFKGLTVYGKSTQITTTGAQLLTSAVIKVENCGVTLTKKDSVWHLEGTNTADGARNIRLMEPTEHFKLPAGTYTLSFSKDGVFPIETNISISKVANPDISSEQIWTGIGNAGLNTPTKFILDGTEEALSIFVNFPAGEPISCDLYVMLNAGDTVLPWEPYTGGKPSPSPDYPQEIVNSKGNLTVRGKNLYDPSVTWNAKGWISAIQNSQGKVTITAKSGWVNASFLSPAKGDTVTFSCTYRQTETTSRDVYQAFSIATTPDGSYPEVTSYQTSSPNTTETTVSATFVSDTYIGIFLRVDPEGTGLTRTVELTDIQLEYGSEATAYEPYYEPQTLSLTTPNGLPGIPVDSGGNYTDEAGQQWICDELDLERGVRIQRLKYITLQHSDLLHSEDNDKNSTHWYLQYFIRDSSLNGTCIPAYKKVMCSKVVIIIQSEETNYSYPIVAPYGHSTEVELRFRAPKSLYASAAEYAADLDGCVVAYPLATPVETPLAGSEIAAYKGLRAYTGTTVVEASDGAGLSVSYGCDLKAAEKDVNTLYARLMAEMEDLNEDSKTL